MFSIMNVSSVDVIARAQQRQATILPFQQMGNELLDTMQGALICLDRHHIIVDVSQTIKSFFGFDQVRCDHPHENWSTMNAFSFSDRFDRPIDRTFDRRQWTRCILEVSQQYATK